MDRERLKYWLALTLLKGIGKKVLRSALEESGNPRAIFEERKEDLKKDDKGLSKALSTPVDWEAIERIFDRLETLGAEILTINDEAYPSLLTSTFDPPLLLYTLGAMDPASIEETPTIAIVGTRSPSHYGIRTARLIAEDLARAEVTVISGMARGCDSSAHRGALDAKGRTIAVLGTGIDVPYPAENRALYEEIIDTGLIISEFTPGTSPLPYNFPIRNRIISGLSLGVLVIEAPIRSGAMMTARLALESGREVFAIPGKINSLKSAGTNKLIKDGAVLCVGATDILEELNLTAFSIKETVNESGKESGGGMAKMLLERLKIDFGDNIERVRMILAELTVDEPVHIDRITSQAGLQVQTASSLLLEMELKGYVEQQPGKCFLIKG